MHFLTEYGLFLAKSLTLMITILLIVLGTIVITTRSKAGSKEYLDVKKLNDRYDDMAETINSEVMSKQEFKKYLKQKKKEQKAQEKETRTRKRVFVLDFDGDIRATEVAPLSEEITAILNVATVEDEVVVKLESSGGMVHAYGLGASQLQRIKNRQIPLTVIVDKVAASGGYLMACVADQILAAPFAIIGSIGVIAQLPNFHRLLKKNDIDYEQITSGEYKRTISLFAENTEKGRKKMQEEIEDIHMYFKNFIHLHRKNLDIQTLATGETWLASRAHELNLIDTLITSDDYLLNASKQADIYQVHYYTKASFAEKLSSLIHSTTKKALALWQRSVNSSSLI
jgi:serine protease SohB